MKLRNYDSRQQLEYPMRWSSDSEKLSKASDARLRKESEETVSGMPLFLKEDVLYRTTRGIDLATTLLVKSATFYARDGDCLVFTHTC
ncbi:hypothetical protein CRYUN_Cryun19dG0116100 [Craigia yunnanensis]